MNETATALRDVRVPEKFFNRIKLGDDRLDRLFGGDESPGLLPGSSCLFTGAPGAGKSTWSLQLSESMSRLGRQVYYNLGEENRYMVKLRSDRLGLTGNFAVGQIDEVDNLCRFVLERKVDVLFQDSLQTLHDRDRKGRSGLISIATKLHRLAHERDVTVIIVGQCTKSGVFAGPNEVKHELDAHLHLSISADGGNGRSLEFSKNRGGPSGIPFDFEMGQRGLSFKAPRPATDVSMAPRTKRGEGQRELIRSIAKSRLLDGEMISGYCFQRLGADCSGGFWRGMVREAVDELSKEGYGLMERKQDGRTFVFINKWAV